MSKEKIIFILESIELTMSGILIYSIWSSGQSFAKNPLNIVGLVIVGLLAITSKYLKRTLKNKE